MNLNQQTLSDKVRLGEEPSNNTILGIDGGTSFDLPFLTRALDALPMLQTHEPSSLKISGEAAYMMPDPNTSKSTIPADNGEAIAYIDDFEGSRRTVPVGITFTHVDTGKPPGRVVVVQRNGRYHEDVFEGEDGLVQPSSERCPSDRHLPAETRRHQPCKQHGNGARPLLLSLYARDVQLQPESEQYADAASELGRDYETPVGLGGQPSSGEHQLHRNLDEDRQDPERSIGENGHRPRGDIRAGDSQRPEGAVRREHHPELRGPRALRLSERRSECGRGRRSRHA